MLRGVDLKSLFLRKQEDRAQEFLGMNFRPVEKLNFITLPKQILYHLEWNYHAPLEQELCLKSSCPCSHDDADQNIKARNGTQDFEIYLVNNNKIY